MRATEAHFNWQWAHQHLECYLIGEGSETIPQGDGFRRSRTIGQPVIERPVSLDGASPQPTFTLSQQSAQQLMDQLWLCGLRPTEGTGSAGSLAATEKHLNDMRAIVSKQLEVQLGKSNGR